MTNRLSAGVLLGAAAVVFTAVGAHAERPWAREWTRRGNDAQTNHNLPMFFRSSAGTSWVRVHNTGLSPCSPADTLNSNNGQTIERVWCFEGGSGDSTWPAVPAGQNTGSKKEAWNHWSAFKPPVTPLSKWHLTQMNANASTWNAWAGCDSITGVTGFSNNDASCSDNAYWIKKKGYGDNWNFALELRADGATNSAGSTIKFDVRYDSECNYDYLYVEYSTDVGVTWTLLQDAGPPNKKAVFNAVSGNNVGAIGRACGTDYFGCSDQFNPGSGTVNWNGNNHSAWIANVQFPIPSNVGGGVRVRWRAFSDGAWSDQDGRGDTDGLAAIDNVLLTNTTGGGTASDGFETGTASPLNGRAVPGETVAGSAVWSAGGILGVTHDGWHMSFNPQYANKNNTCTFSDDIFWTSKPDGGAIPGSANGYDFFLVSPVIDCNGWTGGVVEYAEYLCMLDVTNDYANQQGRFYDAANGWSPWTDFDGFITFAGCEFWNMNTTDDLTQYLGLEVDSLQIGWEALDVGDNPGDFGWGKHGAVIYIIDNVSFGSFDGEGTVFTARTIDIFADTFSKSDPAHTPFLQLPEQGIWKGLTAAPPGTRQFANADSLNVEINDFNGITAANVDLWWRHDNGGSGSFGAFSKIDMSFATPNPTSPTDEGTYRAIIGKDDGTVQDAEGTANNRLIWKAGTTVQYYVKVTDNNLVDAVWPNTADDATPVYFEFSVLPFNKLTPAGQKILLVDDVGGRGATDFENSNLFDATGGAGNGAFGDPAIDVPENLIEGALVLLFGGSETDPKWDKYDVQGAGSSVQCEPNAAANSSKGLGGYITESGTPAYDVLIWPQLDLDAYSFADTTRINLKTYIDFGGNLLACGNEIALFLSDADSSIGFLHDYFGADDIAEADDATTDRTLNITGQAGTSLNNVELGIYGECPVRYAFDRMKVAVTPATGSQVTLLATYTDGNAADNGRPSVIKNVRRGADNTFGTADDGVAVLCGFDLSALLSDASRACVMGRIFATDMGITVPVGNTPACAKNGTDAPVVNARFGFQLAQAAPNPFTKTTSIKFSIASKEHVTVEVFNILGQKVRTLVNETMEANSYVRDWDGRSDGGESVSNGIYFYKMVAGNFSDTKKAVLLK